MTALRVLASLVALALFFIAPPSFAGDKYGGPDGGTARHRDSGVRIVVPGLERRDRDRRYERRRYDDRRGCREFDPSRPWLTRRRCVE